MANQCAGLRNTKSRICAWLWPLYHVLERYISPVTHLLYHKHIFIYYQVLVACHFVPNEQILIVFVFLLLVLSMFFHCTHFVVHSEPCHFSGRSVTYQRQDREEDRHSAESQRQYLVLLDSQEDMCSIDQVNTLKLHITVR